MKRITGEDIPADLYRLFPQADATYIAAPPAKERVRRMRVNFQYTDTDYLYVLPVDSVADEPLRVRYNVPQSMMNLLRLVVCCGGMPRLICWMWQ